VAMFVHHCIEEPSRDIAYRALSRLSNFFMNWILSPMWLALTKLALFTLRPPSLRQYQVAVAVCEKPVAPDGLVVTTDDTVDHIEMKIAK